MKPEDILSYAKQFAGGAARKYRLDVDDVVQDCALKALAYTGDDLTPGLVHAIARSVIADHMRESRRDSEVSATDGTLEAVGLPVEDHALRVGLKVDVQRALECLTVEERIVAWNVGALGFTFEGCAQRLGIHPSSIYRRWENAVSKLRILLMDYAPEGWVERQEEQESAA